jgi:hypothetical protein
MHSQPKHNFVPGDQVKIRSLYAMLHNPGVVTVVEIFTRNDGISTLFSYEKDGRIETQDVTYYERYSNDDIV